MNLELTIIVGFFCFCFFVSLSPVRFLIVETVARVQGTSLCVFALCITSLN